MAGTSKSDQPMSLFGPLRPILIPCDLAMDPEELGRALAAWRYRLSRDEIQLLECVACGMTNGEIANRLDVAEENTIKNRLSTVFRKLGVSNRVQAATIAMTYGFGGQTALPRRPNE